MKNISIEVRERSIVLAALFLVAPFVVGCGGSTANTVSAPPTNVQTPEEMAAQQKAYMESQKEMEQRDKQYR
ncbi:secreted protein [Rhodopirellula maiorica SM1]|uniref:Secreted protein n=1 Tax=Rhodopirellula maiorica SM1 TaxID=1265738 RepID=M5RIH6_9BACT|nr:hypothetical protein [Rhodopirellula maiorica]EMI19001.1 secreted protein [Rhodopirellula maiorica SM1]